MTNGKTIVDVLADFGLDMSKQNEEQTYTWYRGYADQNNEDNPNGVIVADWNELPRGLDSALEAAGFAVDWADMTADCSDCGNLVATEPSHMWWQPYYRWVQERTSGKLDYEGNGEGPLVCLDCLEHVGQDWLEQFEGHPSMLNTAHTVKPEDFDYEKITAFETDACVWWDKDKKHLAVSAEFSPKYKALMFNLDKRHDTYMEVSLWARKGEHLEALQQEIESRLDDIEASNPAAYAQILLRPFRPEDYSIVEARNLLESLGECE